MMKVQITEIDFEIDSIDEIQNPQMRESLQEEYVGKVFDLDIPDARDDENVGDKLVEVVADDSGLLINYVNYNYVDENL